MYRYSVLVAVILVAGCTQTSIGAENGVEVSCDSYEVSGFTTQVDTGDADAAQCEVSLGVRYLNSDDYVCETRATIGEGGTAAPCPGLSDVEEHTQLRVEAEFFEPGTTDEIGESAGTFYWRGE